ncbi:unnamed protein product [Chrysoparadoxa australica]
MQLLRPLPTLISVSAVLGKACRALSMTARSVRPGAPFPTLPKEIDGVPVAKRKVGLVLGYVGTHFSGLQMTPGQDIRTIEGVLMEALFNAGAVTEANSGDLNKIAWGRTSRTDKGVHAQKNVVTCKLLLDPESFDADGISIPTMNRINKHLPDDLRLFSVTRVPGGFRGRRECTWREYEYYVPWNVLGGDQESLDRFSAALEHYSGSNSFHNFAKIKKQKPRKTSNRVWAGPNEQAKGWEMSAADNAAMTPLSSGDDDLVAEDEQNEEDEEGEGEHSIRKAETPEERLERQQARRRWLDGDSIELVKIKPQMQGVMYSVKVLDDNVEVDGVRLVRVQLRGVSFLYHQIRYMMGSAIGEARGVFRPGHTLAALQAPFKIPVPLAPAEGLMLCSQGFTRHSNAAVIEPAMLCYFDTSPTQYDDSTRLSSKGRMQALLNENQVHEADAFRDSTLLPEMAKGWKLIEDEWLDHLGTYQRSASASPSPTPLEAAVADHMNSLQAKEELSLREEATAREEALYRNHAKAAKYLPKAFPSALVCHFGLVPGTLASCITQALVLRIKKGMLSITASKEDLIELCEKVNVCVSTEDNYQFC